VALFHAATPLHCPVAGFVVVAVVLVGLVVVEVGGFVLLVDAGFVVVEVVFEVVDVGGGGGVDPTGQEEARTAVIQALPTSGY
jgi:hypothetical protein